MQRQIEKAAYAFQLEVESGARTVVGSNRFVEEDQEASRISVLEIPDGLEERKAGELEALRRERDNDAVAAALDVVHEAASSEVNLVEAVFEAVKVEATLGEVADRLRDAFGEYNDPTRSI